MTETAKIKLPLIASAQAQKHVTVNEALARVDAVTQMSVESRTLPTPPFVVSEGESYLIAAGATDAWVGQEGKLASFLNGSWIFLDPLFGWQVWVGDEMVRLTFDGVNWIENLLAASVNRAALRAEVVETDITLVGGSGSEDTPFVIPAHTSVLAVTGRVLTGITGGCPTGL